MRFELALHAGADEPRRFIHARARVDQGIDLLGGKQAKLLIFDGCQILPAWVKLHLARAAVAHQNEVGVFQYHKFGVELGKRPHAFIDDIAQPHAGNQLAKIRASARRIGAAADFKIQALAVQPRRYLRRRLADAGIHFLPNLLRLRGGQAQNLANNAQHIAHLA